MEIPPGVTEASIAQCMEMGFTKALSVGWLAVTNNNPEQALEHLLKGELPPSPGDAARPPVAGSQLACRGPNSGVFEFCSPEREVSEGELLIAFSQTGQCAGELN